MTGPVFKTEAALCEAFLSAVPKEWTPYPETCGFDIVLVHRASGAQIGIEAKLILNAKALCQVTEHRSRLDTGPDFRAVLAGRAPADMAPLAERLGIKVLMMRTDQKGRFTLGWRCALPHLRRQTAETIRNTWLDGNEWVDEAPSARLVLPEYVPQVRAGVPSPQVLSAWTIQAMKLCQMIEETGTVTRAHFNVLRLSPTRWCDGHWLERAGERGHWRPGPRFPADRFRLQHPVTWAQIEEDKHVWMKATLDALEAAAHRRTRP